MKFVATADRIDVTGTEVSAGVSIGILPAGGFGLVVELDVHAPALDRGELGLVGRAHRVGSYANVAGGNIEVALSVVCPGESTAGSA